LNTYERNVSKYNQKKLEPNKHYIHHIKAVSELELRTVQHSVADNNSVTATYR
jgi:hypothetical protein